MGGPPSNTKPINLLLSLSLKKASSIHQITDLFSYAGKKHHLCKKGLQIHIDEAFPAAGGYICSSEVS